MTAAAGEQLLFSYGTLQLEQVQRALFGRTLAGSADTLAGWRAAELAFRDPDAVATSGVETHLALVADEAAPPIAGMLYTLTTAELAAADAYETDAYRRIEVTFASGRRGWVYIDARS